VNVEKIFHLGNVVNPNNILELFIVIGGKKHGRLQI